MKTNLIRMGAMAAVLLTTAALSGARAGEVNQPAQPGTAQETNSKTQMNNPKGPAEQPAASMPADSKRNFNTPAGPTAQENRTPVTPSKTQQQENQELGR